MNSVWQSTLLQATCMSSNSLIKFINILYQIVNILGSYYLSAVMRVTSLMQLSKQNSDYMKQRKSLKWVISAV